MDRWKEWAEGERWQTLLSEVSSKLSVQRMEHTLRVVNVAAKLAEQYKQDIHLASLAALFHDYAKELRKEEMKKILLDNGRQDIINLAVPIWHAPVGAYLIKERYPFGEHIFDAVFYHTTGRQHMTELEKIVFLADYIEPKRYFPKLYEIRKLTWVNLDQAMYVALNTIIEKLLNNHFIIAEITVEARNYFLTKRSV